MFKILLVDDEPIIVEGLYELFSEYKADSLDVYKAYSAQEALDWLAKKRIDIVISDIMMPEMDGLQLLEKIRQNWPECKVIFLTGHDEFAYIYEAVKYSGVSYLLKTESNDNIVEMVERYFEEIISGYRNDELIKKAENKLEKAMPLLQKEFLSDLVDGTEIKQIYQWQLDELSIPLSAERPVILLIGRIVYADDKEFLTCKSNLYSVNSTIEQYLASSASLAGLIYKKDYTVWFIQPKTKNQGCNPDSNKAAAQYFRNMLESVQYVCRESFNLKVSFAIGSDSVPWNEVFFCSTELKSILNNCLRQGMEVIVTDSQYRLRAVEIGNFQKMAFMQLKKLDTLATYMEMGKEEDFLRVFSEMESFCTFSAPNVNVDEEVYYAISLLFISYINRHNMKDIVLTKLNSDRLWYCKSYTTTEEAFRFFRQVAKDIFDTQIIETEKKSLASIHDVQNYIQNNLGKDLSLNSLAELVFFNPKYLSRLFKQTTSVNVSDYINGKRLAKAKDLLKQSHIKIYEIAHEVGYSSNSYFTMFFKKGVNMTPQDYRDSFAK